MTKTKKRDMNIGKGASLDKRKNKERGTALVHRNIKNAAPCGPRPQN